MADLTDAEWLRYLVEMEDDPPDVPPEGSSCIYLTNELVTRLRSIAARLERPAVEGGFTLSPTEFSLLKKVFLHTGGTQIDMGMSCVSAANALKDAIWGRTGVDFEVYT